MMKKYTFLLLFALLSFLAFGQAPSGYYDGTDGLTGEALKKQLHRISTGHKVWAYSDFRDTILPDLDEDPDNPDNIILFYKNASIPKANFASNNEPDYWNREHTWPKSHGFPDLSDTAYTDVHNLRPSDATVNTSKSNKDFNDVENIAANAEGEAPDTYTNADFWDPRDEIKGDVARILFYMDMRYESEALDLELVDHKSFSGDPELGVLFTLLRWHAQDPVDAAEIARHEKAYGYQNNRNPFVDHPEWVGEIWGTASEPFVSLDQSNFSQNFGTVPFGQSLVQQYTVNAYNLEGDLTVTVEAPFYVSSDNSTFSGSSTFTHANGVVSENFTVYLKFEPQQADGGTYEGMVTHASAGLTSVELNVQGKEGEVTVTTIAKARQQELGSMAYVTGVVIDAGNNSGNSRVIFDGTAGIVVRSFDAGNESANLVQGDSIVVSGGLSDYAGVLQIEQSPITITLVAQGAMLPEPQEVTIAEVGEQYESELVVIRDAAFKDAGGTFAGGGSAGNFEIKDATGTMVFRIGSSEHPLVGTRIPNGLFDITGFVGEFAGDYQISVRDLEDMVLVDEEEEERPPVISIAEARTMVEGSVVTVKGIVIGGENNNRDNRVVFDGTAGLVVRSLDLGNASSVLVMGDSVMITGGIFDYNGLFEIEESPVYIDILNSGNALPEPQEITLSAVGEEYESELISLRNVSFVETGEFAVGNYTLIGDDAEVVFRVGTIDHPLVGTSIPQVSVDLIGYVGQSNEDYQVFVRVAEDLTFLEEVLGVKDARPSLNLVYPNPVSGLLHLHLPEGIDYPVNLSLFDLQGKKVKTAQVTEGTLSVEELQSGMYLLTLDKEGRIFYNRIIIE